MSGDFFFALVVMVMPCGLTPVDGIDFVDRFYFSVYACARVRPTSTHPHTRTNQCTERCLRKTGRCSTNLSKEPRHFQNPTSSTCRTLLTEGGGALIQQVGNGSGSEQPSWRENWVGSRRREHLFAVHIQAAGCRRETSRLQKPHFSKLFVVSCTESHRSFNFLVLPRSQIQPRFSVCMRFSWS